MRLRTDAPDWVIEAEAVRVGEDVLVWIYGGEKPHIGAVASAQPRPSLADPTKTSATASVFAYVGHKEDDVAKHAAEALAAALKVRVVVTAGIHWDNIPPAGVRAVQRHVAELTDKLKAALAG